MRWKWRRARTPSREKSIFELQDLVKKITLKEKIEESRELASDVQQSLYGGLGSKHSTLRDRGVKKAPFVVLIGANMPSILAEISFVSNPTDAAKLETPEYREKIAESLYKGIAKYAGGLSGVKVASKLSKLRRIAPHVQPIRLHCSIAQSADRSFLETLPLPQ